MRFLVIVVLFGFAVAGSAFLAKVGMRGSVEAELAESARQVLEKAGFAEVKVEFDHLDGALSGTVDRPGDVDRVLGLLKTAVPAAHWPEAAETGISIRPTLPPKLTAVRREGSDEVGLGGVLSSLDDNGRALLGSRLHSLPGIAKVDNAVTLDPMVLPFPELAEFISLASGLLTHDGPVEVSLDETALTVSGTVPNAGLKTSLLELASRIGADSIDDRITVKPPATFTRTADLKITRNRFGVVLNGVYPSEPDRAALLALFRKAGPSLSVTDRIQIGENCGPAVWQESLETIIPALLAALTGELTAEFTAGQVRVSGVAPDEAARRELLEQLSSLTQPPGGEPLKLETEIHVEGERVVTSVELTAVYEGGLLALKGRLPEPAIVAAIEARLQDKMPDLLVKNEVSASPEAVGDEWAAGLVEFFAEALGRISIGTFTFKDGVLDLEGRTIALPDRQLIQNLAVNLLPPRFKVQNRLLHADQPFPKPVLQPEQRTRLAEALKPLPVYFEKNSEILAEKEKPKVASIAEAVKGAGAEVSLVITGFADNIGDADRNKELSLRRAESVRAELIRLGLPEASLGVASEGEDVSRVSRSELWKSRRVEVTLKPSETETARPNP
jgi:outer membrane protein OmpA-like peptidoglycan-associated protein